MTSPSHIPPDAEIVARSLAGESEAFEVLVQRHLGAVYAIARGRLGQREAAEDLAQEVFVRAHLALGQLRDPERFAAWICRITRNLSGSWLRRKQSRSQMITLIPLDDEMENTVKSEAKDAREILDRKQKSDRITTAIDQLSPTQREVVLMHFTQDLGVREIARRLDVAPSTVSRKIDKAVGRLRGVLESELRASAASLRPRSGLATRTAALVAAVAVSGEVKAAVTAAGGATVKSGSIMSTSASVGGLWEGLLPLITSGGKIMAMNKTLTAAAVAVVAIGGYAVHHSNQGRSSLEDAPAVVASPALSAQDSQSNPQVLSDRARELRQVYLDTLEQTDFSTDPYAATLAVIRTVNPDDTISDMLWLFPRALPPLSQEVLNAPLPADDVNPDTGVSLLRLREILQVDVPSPPAERNVAHVRYRDSVDGRVRQDVFVYEDSLWKPLVSSIPDGGLPDVMTRTGLEISGQRVVSYGNFLAHLGVDVEP